MNENKSSAAIILLAWLFVGLPLGWGVYNTVRNSMKLFRGPPVPVVHACVGNSGAVPPRSPAV